MLHAKNMHLLLALLVFQEKFVNFSKKKMIMTFYKIFLKFSKKKLQFAYGKENNENEFYISTINPKPLIHPGKLPIFYVHFFLFF